MLLGKVPVYNQIMWQHMWQYHKCQGIETNVFWKKNARGTLLLKGKCIKLQNSEQKIKYLFFWGKNKTFTCCKSMSYIEYVSKNINSGFK